jgi:hypothetical protein
MTPSSVSVDERHLECRRFKRAETAIATIGKR